MSSDPGVEVYEGYEIQLKPAPIFKRFLAYGTDLGIVTLVVYGIGLFSLFAFAGMAIALRGLVGEAARAAGRPMLVLVVGLFVLGLLGLFHGYFVFFEYKRKGQTPGKKIFGLRVVSLRSGPPTLGQIMLRDVFRFVDCMMFVPGLVSMLATQRRQRIGDLVASTLIVYSAEKEKAQSFLYVSAVDYHPLRAALEPRPLVKAECAEFLEFAFPYLLLKTSQPGVDKLARWEAECRSKLTGARAAELNQLTIFLFYAEYCLQTLNQSRQPRTRP